MDTQGLCCKQSKIHRSGSPEPRAAQPATQCSLKPCVQGPNLLKLSRKEQCLALLTQLRTKFKVSHHACPKSCPGCTALAV